MKGVAAVVAVLAVVGAAAAFLLASGQEPGAAVPSGVAVSASVRPQHAQFADAVTARVLVLVDPRRVRPDSVHVRAAVEPWRADAAPVVRSTARRIVSLRYRFRLTCLRKTCLPPLRKTRTFRFPPVLVSARRADGTSALVVARWPPIVVGGRLTPQVVSQPSWDDRLGPLAAPTFRVDPLRSARILDALAALLAALGAALLAWNVVPTLRRLLTRDDLAGLESVDRALALVRRAARHGDADAQRKALDRLARELRRGGDDDLAGGARRLAWSRPEPGSDNLDAFAGRVESGRRNGR